MWPTFRRRAGAFACCALAGTTACSRNRSPAGEEVTASAPRQRDVITREEILASPHRLVDTYQAVRGLRPQFLTAPQGRSRSTPLSVYIDGIRQQAGLPALASIPSSAVDRVEYLDPNRAENQLGSRAAGGALMVTLTGQRRVPASARDSAAR